MSEQLRCDVEQPEHVADKDRHICDQLACCECGGDHCCNDSSCPVSGGPVRSTSVVQGSDQLPIV